ncbi:MAG TPA: hypothetical protein VLC79_01545 [Cellvibrio sp.]|nr:hypothetical protein [Cellvibrio sp.]
MIQTYHHGRFEFFVVVIVIAIIALAALSRYSLMAEDARILRLEIISNHFMTGAANARVQFLIANVAVNKPVKLGGIDKPVYFSEQGWPVSIHQPITLNYRPTEDDCYQLWHLLLQNPAPIVKGSAKNRGQYRVFALANNCRYEFSDGTAYFDYFPLDGRLTFSAK